MPIDRPRVPRVLGRTRERSGSRLPQSQFRASYTVPAPLRDPTAYASSRAVVRSAIRSSTVSMPTETRISASWTSSGEPATEA